MNQEIQAKIEQKNKSLKDFGEISERFEQKEAAYKALEQQNKILKQEIEELIRSDTLFALNHKRSIEKELDEAVKKAEGFEKLMKQKYPLNDLDLQETIEHHNSFFDSITQERRLPEDSADKENRSMNVLMQT